MKHTSKKRLRLELSTIRNLATDQLRGVNGGMPTDRETEGCRDSSGTVSMGPGPTVSGCPSNSCERCNA